MKKLEARGSSCLLGINAERRDQIAYPVRLTCDGCGTDVYVSRPLIEPAKQAALIRSHKLYIVCRSCCEPFFEEVAQGGELAGTPAGIADVIGDVQSRRRRFLAGLN
jgi:hypothetical protein